MSQADSEVRWEEILDKVSLAARGSGGAREELLQLLATGLKAADELLPPEQAGLLRQLVSSLLQLAPHRQP